MDFNVDAPSSSSIPVSPAPLIKAGFRAAFRDAGHGEAGIRDSEEGPLGEEEASPFDGDKGASIVGPRGDMLFGSSTLGGLALCNGSSA